MSLISIGFAFGTEIPIWLVFAIVSSAFCAIVIVLDAHCVDEVFDHPLVGIVTSGMTVLMAIPLLSVGLLFSPLAPMSVTTVALCALTGFLFIASQGFYFQSLATAESGIVAAYWNLIPLLLIVVSFVLFGEVLTLASYTGAGIIIISSVAICLLDGNQKSRWSTFGMMFAGALLQVAYFLVQKHVFNRCPVYQAFLLISLSMGLSGVSTLLIPGCRLIFRKNWPRIRTSLRFLFAIEVTNLVAIGTTHYAVSFGIPSLVSAVEASIPGCTFLISMVLFASTGKYGEEEARNHLLGKLLLVCVMVFGVWLLS